MRIALLAAVLLAFTSSALFAVTADNWNKMVFADGKARSIADFGGQTTAVFAFCRG